MPSTLKAWVDHVVRVGRTFSFDLARGDESIEPIQTGKSLVSAKKRGLAPSVDRMGRHSESDGGLVDGQQPAVAQRGS